MNLQHTPVLLATANAAVEALAANVARTYLSIQNKSNAEAVVKVKVDGSNFLNAQNAVQKISFSRVPDNGEFKLRLGEEETAAIAFDDDNEDVEAALEALTGVGAGNVDVTGDFTEGFTATFAGALENTAVPLMEVVGNTLNDLNAAIGQEQVISFSAKPEAGTFRLLLGELETADLAWNASTATIKATLNALSGPQVGSVARDAGTGALTFTFANEDVVVLAVTENLLTNNDAQASSVQKLYAAPAPVAGSVKLMFGAQTTVAIPYNATADQVRDAIRDLPTVDEGNVAVAGDNFTSGFTVTFQAALASQSVPALIPTQNTLSSASGDEVRVDVVQHTAGGGLTICEASVAITVEPFTATAEGTVEELAEGRGQAGEGIELLAGETKEFTHPNVPLEAVFLVANVENTPVEIVEG